MLTFTKLGSYGRLGNQFFQYAALKSTCLKNNFICKLPDLSKNNWHGQDCLLDKFSLEYDLLTDIDYRNIKYRLFENETLAGNYNNSLENVLDNTDILGFFQNTIFFKDYEKQIKKEFLPKKELIEKAYNIYKNYKKNGYTITSLHIRRGDNTDGTNSCYNKHLGENPFDKKHTLGNYLNNCLDLFYNKKNIFLVFTGGSRTGNDIDDIKWAKKYFSNSDFMISDTNDPLIDFILMTLCDNNVVSFSSTFSWWSAFLNLNENNMVIAPKDFHLDQINRENFFPNNWKII